MHVCVECHLYQNRKYLSVSAKFNMLNVVNQLQKEAEENCEDKLFQRFDNFVFYFHMIFVTDFKI